MTHSDIGRFVTELDQHLKQSDLRHCRNCFMTGKPCINQREISNRLGTLEKKDDDLFSAKAFVLMPFKPLLDHLYISQLKPCLESIFKSVNRADDITMTGYIICEKICKEIQSSQLICAEISSDNHNVFYELGLAFALRRGICLLIQRDKVQERKDLLSKLDIKENEITKYDPFDILDKTALMLKLNQYSPSMDKKYITILLSDMGTFEEKINDSSFEYKIDSICKSAIHRCLDQLDSNPEESTLKHLERRTIIISEKDYLDVSSKSSVQFCNIQEYIENSECVFICTSENEPTSYFWLGYAHGLDKVVIPISVRRDFLKMDKNASYDRLKKKYGLPFDVRALWHIYFSKDKIDQLEKQVNNILNIIAFGDRERTNRKRFWGRFLEPGQVSIFVGAVELTKNNRHVVGEWDYRAVAELTSFFTSIKETTESYIQTPTIQISQQLIKNNDDQNLNVYIKDLENRLNERNAIVIASADVNDMTELALCKMKKLNSPFQPARRNETDFHGYVAFKETDKKEADNVNDQYIFFEINEKQSDVEYRGFRRYIGGVVNPKNIFKMEYELYNRSTKDISKFYAHLTKHYFKDTGKQVIVLQGITGPATLGVVQALTGAINKQFTIYYNKRNYEDFTEQEKKVIEKVKSESSQYKECFDNKVPVSQLLDHMSEKITKELELAFTDNQSSVEALLIVYVMNEKNINYDARKIVWWEFAVEPNK